MRTITTAERTLLSSDEREVTRRVEVQNIDGTWKELTSLSGTGFSNLDFVESLEWGRGIDDPTWTGTVTLVSSQVAPSGADISLSPQVETSPANVDDVGDPAPLLEGMRRVRWFTTTKDFAGGSFTEHKVFDGYVVEVAHDGEAIALSCADLGHLLVITQIEDERVYDATGQLLEDAIQQILDDNFGAGVIPLVVDSSITAEPIVLSSKFKQERVKVMEAIVNLAQNTRGAVVRYQWNGENMELTLFAPPRGSTTSLFSYPKTRINPDAKFVVKTDDIRNVGTIKYRDSDKKQVVSISYTVPASVTLYGRRYFEFTEAATSQINTEAEAIAFLSTAIDDLAQPKAEGAYEPDYNWAIDVYDVYTFVANDVQFTSDQLHSITSVRHSLAAGQAVSRIETRGNVAGYSRRWIKIEGKGATPIDEDLLMVSFGGMGGEASMYGGELFNGKPDGAVWPYIWVGKDIYRVHIWARQTKAGAVVPLWPPTTSDIYKAVTLTRPDGKIPRDGNFTYPTIAGDPFSGRRFWRNQIPIPTVPGATRAIIMRGEKLDGTFGPEWRAYAQAVEGSGSDPGEMAFVSVTRINATTVRVQHQLTNEPAGVMIFRDDVPIDTVAGSSSTVLEWFDEELNPAKSYLYQVNAVSNNNSGARVIVLVPAWTTTLAFTNGTPKFEDVAGVGPRVRIEYTGAPVGTVKVRVQKSRDATYDPYTTVKDVPIASFPFFDAVVLAGAFYRLQALDSDGNVLDTSLPIYWTSPL